MHVSRSRRVRACACACPIEILEGRVLLANRIHGVDVSQFQGAMDWNKTWDQNARFAYVRASRSGLGEDLTADTNVPGAKNRGLLTGVYHHASPILNNEFTDPIVDADTFVDAAWQYMLPGYLRPVVDIEEDETLNQNGYTINTWTAAFIARVHERVGVAPMIYTTGRFAEFFLDATTVAASPDVWIAIHFASSDPITTNSQPTFNGNVGPGAWRNTTPTPEESWDFWQYSGTGNGKGALYGSAGNPDIDLNVFNGDSIDVLKQRFVIGAAQIPTLFPPALDGDGFVPHTAALLDWTDSAGAVAYDVFLDNMTTPAASNITQSQWNAPMMLGGVHTWRIVAKGVIADDDTHVSSAIGTFTSATLPLPDEPGGATPNGVIVNAHPVVLDWSDTPTALTYDVYLGTGTTPTFADLTASQTSPINPQDGTRLWRVVAKNPAGQTSSPQWSYTMDRTPPTATPNLGSPIPFSPFVNFTISYADVTTAVDVATLGSDDLLVTGPNGFSVMATLSSVNLATNGSPRVATYRVDAPGGTWSRYDNGTYTVAQIAESVRDMAANARPAGVLGTFNVNMPFARKIGAVLHLEHGPQGTPIHVAPSAADVQATEGATTLTFSGITQIIAHGSAGDDTFEYSGPDEALTQFDGGGAGNDTVRVRAGLLRFGEDLSATSPDLTVVVDAGASATFFTTQHLKALIVNGSAAFSPDGDYTIATRSLSLSPGAQLDMTDTNLIVDPLPGDPAPPDVEAYVAAAYHAGAWDRPGLTTSMPQAQPSIGLTTLAVIPAGDVLNIAGTQTKVWNGHTVSADATIVKYTWAGDLNLDGLIDAADYGVIDNFVQFPGTDGYVKGDFSFDGVIDAVDYGIIDNTIQLQGPPIVQQSAATSSVSAASAVPAVPAVPPFREIVGHSPMRHIPRVTTAGRPGVSPLGMRVPDTFAALTEHADDTDVAVRRAGLTI